MCLLGNGVSECFPSFAVTNSPYWWMTFQLVINSDTSIKPLSAVSLLRDRAGKSLCYQLPPLYLNQVAIVVSPLISLMEDRE